MRKIFSSVEMPETILIRDALLHAGIAAAVQDVHSGLAAMPAFRAPVEVWIEHDTDLEKAMRVVRETVFRLADTARDQLWKCAECTEQDPQSLDTCWNCDSASPGIARE